MTEMVGCSNGNSDWRVVLNYLKLIDNFLFLLLKNEYINKYQYLFIHFFNNQ